MEMITVDKIFQQLCNYIRGESRVESMSALFAKQPNDSDRVDIATQLLKEHNLIVPCNKFLRENKSLTRSVELRNSGNKAFQKKEDRRALILYTQSIATAPVPNISKISNQELQSCLAQNENDKTSEALALALANRSAVLFLMGNFKGCLSDIRQAMKYNYPNKLLYKLFERQGKVFQTLGRIKNAMESVYNALKWLSSATALTEEKRQTISIELSNLLQHLENSKAAEESNCLQIYDTQSLLPSCSYSKNHEILCASDCVELKYMSEMGRYIAARSDIQPGDVLAVEKPFASVLLSDCYKTHCYNCLQRSQSLLPCSHCSMVMYCSEECSASSWNNNHSIDCPLLDILQKLEIGKMGFLALRIIIVVCKGQDLNSLMASLEYGGKCSSREKGFSNGDTYSSTDYSGIYWLVGNTEKRVVSDIFRRAVTAACILNCLETMTDFFSKIINVDTDSPPPDVARYKLLVGGLLLRHLQNLPCNAHEVSELVRAEDASIEQGVPLWQSVEIGAAAYAMLSLVNHSCDPNVVRHSYRGDTAVLRAIRPIVKGEQVLDNYGYHYALHDRTERRSRLETQYYFTCGCVTCTEDGHAMTFCPTPIPHTYAPGTGLLKLNRCRHVLPIPPIGPAGNKVISCISCNEDHNMTDIMNKIEKSSEEFRHNLEQIVSGEGCHWEDLAQKLVCHLQLLDKFIRRPWKEYSDCQEAIKQCFAMTANCYK